jgi:hypothetical protein
VKSLILGFAAAALLCSTSSEAAELSYPVRHRHIAVRHGGYYAARYSRLYDAHCDGPYVGGGWNGGTYYGGPWIDLRCFGGPVY